MYKFKVFCLPVLAVLNLHCVSGEALINVRKASTAANERKALVRQHTGIKTLLWQSVETSVLRGILKNKETNRYTLSPPSILKVCTGTHQG